MDILVVVDMQNDFIDGTLGTDEALEILPAVVDKIKTFDGRIYATRDTHNADYMNTQEGQLLPVEHCIKGTRGWEIHTEISALIEKEPFDKPCFGSVELAEQLKKINSEEKITSITLIGICTDICVISNAMLLKAFLPEVPIKVDSACCAGVTPEAHNIALEAMKSCQIEII